MLWWIATAVVWLASAGAIFLAMANVVRRKSRAFSARTLSLYGFHGVTALLALWLAVKAMGR